MRYRLRTLLILVTVISLPLAWLAWLRQNAAFHRREFARRVSIVANAMGNSPEEMQTIMADFGQCRSVTQWVRAADGDGTQWTLFHNEPYTWTERGKVDAHDYATAVYHSILAERYALAQFRPWALFSEPAVKPEAVYVPLSDDSAWHGIARPPMVELKAE